MSTSTTSTTSTTAPTKNPTTFYTYSGNWNQGVKDGAGTFTLRDMSTYTGDFMNGEMTGQGVRTYADGSVYTGCFENGERRGYGVETKVLAASSPPASEVYEGGWEANKREGKGKLVLGNGDVMEGIFKNHRLHTPSGTLITENSTYTGSFVRGVRSGKGAISLNENRGEFAGNFLNDKKSGFGKFSCNVSGISYKGEWADDEIAFPATFIDTQFQKLEEERVVKNGETKGEFIPRTINALSSVVKIDEGGNVMKINVVCAKATSLASAKAEAEAEAEGKDSVIGDNEAEGEASVDVASEETARKIRITIRKISEEEGARDAESFLSAAPTPFFVKNPTPQSISSCTSLTTTRPFPISTPNSSLLEFFETHREGLAGATEEITIADNSCVDLTEGEGVYDLGEVGRNNSNLAAKFTVALDFFLPQGAAEVEGGVPLAATDNEVGNEVVDKDEGDDTSLSSWNKTLISSSFLKMSIVNKNSFKIQLGGDENGREWVLPPCERDLAEGEWHSLVVCGYENGSVPTVVIDGSVISGKSNVLVEKTGNFVEEKKEEEDEENEEEELRIRETITVRNCYAKNLGVWAQPIANEVGAKASVIYKNLRKINKITTQNNNLIEEENKNRRKVAEEKTAAAAAAAAEEGEGGEGGGAIEEDTVVVMDGCDRVEEIIRLCVRGRVDVEEIVLSEKIEAGNEYAVVFEDWSDIEEGGGSPFSKIDNGWIIFSV
ncbi:hypothetical protein ScalyP_jg3422 [Parmales sp. scaly parma]|nr:hypothetical protein ScalyP_jg3422 [Parmales sp. scaly parma]